MATNNPKIRYDIEAAVSGGSDVNALANQLDGLANTLEGDLKVQALASAQALRTLGEKQGAIENFRQLKTEVQDASGRLREAQTAAQQLGQKIGTMEAPTRAQAGQLQKLRDAVRTSKDEVQRKTAALDQARGSLRNYGISTDNLALSERNVRAAVQAARTEVSAMVPTYAAAARSAVSSGNQQAQAARTTRSELQSLGDQLRTVQNIAIGALGGSFVGSLAKDVAATADEFNNLQARVKLVTGEGDAFTTAWEGVQAIALRTNSDLEGTATLFTRIAQAGQELGLSQQAALSLTETINQSIQLSGGSADSAKAAITQLVQGLQSGVLRGEEFNSVMEQSPRLARALADGLGVTTGALRDMSKAGQLTTEVVLSTLQGQSAAITAEFEKLPPTVGRAIQNLSTNWTIYVGEVDKATGASQTAATAINFLGQNLRTIAGFLIDAGQAAAAFAALRLAQTFLGIGAAAGVATTAIAANTVAMGANTAASAGAAASVGRFAAILSTLKTFTLLGIVTNFQDIGTWIGEATAKLAGYRDRTSELEKIEQDAARAAAEHARQVNSTAEAKQLAADRAKGLTSEVKLLVGEYERLRSEGKQVGVALEEVAKKASLATALDTRQFGVAMGEMKLSAEDMRQGFELALKGVNLEGFAERAQAAFGASRQDARLLEAAIDASLREAIRRGGSDFELLSTGMGKAARSAIGDTDAIIKGLDRLKAQGIDTGTVLASSLSKAVNTADGQKSIDELRTRIESMRKVLGEKLADGLLADLQKQADKLGATFEELPKKAKTYAERVTEAFKDAGIKTQAELTQMAKAAEERFLLISTSGKASAEGIAKAWRAMAEAQIAANGGVASEMLKAQAATYGLEIAVDKTGKAIVRSMSEGRDATTDYKDAVDKAKKSVEELAEAERKRRGVDKQGFAADEDGKRISQLIQNRTSAQAKLKSLGMDEETARKYARSLFTEQGSYIGKSSGFARSDFDTLDAIMARMVEYENNLKPIGGAASAPSSTASAPPGGRVVTVNLQVGGQTRAVRTDEEGAEAIVQTLQVASLAARG